MASKRSRQNPGQSSRRAEIIQAELDRRPVVPERIIRGGVGSAFWNMIDALGLRRTTIPYAQRNISWVREFYFHAGTQGHMTAEIRGVHLPLITPEFIRDYYQLPAVPECRFTAIIRGEADYPGEDIRRVLVDPASGPLRGSSQIFRANMTRQAKNWLHFITGNIMPRLHRSGARRDLALLLYLLMTGQPVQVDRIIYLELRASIMDARVGQGIIFPHLISDICIRLGVGRLPTDVIAQIASYQLMPEDPPIQEEAEAERDVPHESPVQEEMNEEETLGEEDQPGPSTSAPREATPASVAPPPDLLAQMYQGIQSLLRSQERMSRDIQSIDRRVGRIETVLRVQAASDSSDSDDSGSGR